MTEEARRFLIHWFTDHVQSLPEPFRLAQAARLATQCRKNATEAGIPLVVEAAGLAFRAAPLPTTAV